MAPPTGEGADGFPPRRGGGVKPSVWQTGVRTREESAAMLLEIRLGAVNLHFN
ncbi:hypothetical protein ACVWW1_000112 [Bradyrhizobium sp. JR3.5]